MAFDNWLLKPETLFSLSPIIPVVVIKDLEAAIPTARALLAGGIKILELTLRTPVALEAIHLLTQEMPEVIIGAGTVTTPQQMEACIKAGARFAISPGLTRDLLQTGKDSSVPLIPGVASISELMEGINLGYQHFKFFPAELLGGIPMLKAIHGPFPAVTFCPTGGISEKNFLDYLSLPNVQCVGGTWVVPGEAMREGHWHRITEASVAALKQAGFTSKKD
ncbi:MULTISPECIES: bifunctional 4-hydroxy-2-oxoglutarate aldolase/2-dehydro-3-deoxy-phosphogluconate aldolase [unclassified Legionella]|uniref:bifunctional 4-hydroxy-2-oxoglutarate aldolase/2-dehydro-3-deoxy-phosphogluconate aldolase n=1 Tax=unclassified Legionella TaxID=2622702 RepID=UPI001054A985|nr:MULTISPECIES: bifunctional 4-hydroxy-2-oxoglutarate aldolase/2-dehydro-3-deoxy-phosphogluconate aldolase [unclassified Legionella]MDI9819865.1 bifunctional 4-hydroxy-2-oxoglutarate aldolase/2-dehydro-3-deoxy-phosphogluconate aldolase [Legionella sp. PL877]